MKWSKEQKNGNGIEKKYEQAIKLSDKKDIDEGDKKRWIENGTTGMK